MELARHILYHINSVIVTDLCFPCGSAIVPLMGMPTQASRAITAALRRLDDIGRLRFVLDVATKDPRTMLNGELIDHRNLIRAFVGAWGGHAAWAADPLDVETLDRLRAHVASGLQTLFRDGVPQSWLLEGSYRLVVAHRPEPSDIPRARDTSYRLPFRLALAYHPAEEPDLESQFIVEAAKEIVAGWEEIRRCAWDETFFLRTSSQRYCSPSCTQAAMNAKRKERKRRPPFVRANPAEQVKTLTRAAKAAAQHRAGLPHDETVCPTCAAERKGR